MLELKGQFTVFTLNPLTHLSSVDLVTLSASAVKFEPRPEPPHTVLAQNVTSACTNSLRVTLRLRRGGARSGSGVFRPGSLKMTEVETLDALRHTLGRLCLNLSNCTFKAFFSPQTE